MRIIFLVLLFICMSTLFLFAEKEVMVILPFVNCGGEYKDLYEDLFNGYFYVYFNKLEGFNVLYPSEIVNYRAKNLYNTEDLYTIAVLNDITKQFKTDFILGGEYEVENEILKVTLDIFGRKKIIIKREYEAHIKTDIYDALNHIVMQIAKSLSGYSPATAVLKADTEYPCSLHINGVFYGRLPGRYTLPAGEYDIEIMYKDDFFNDVVFRKNITLKKGQLYDLGEIPVLATYEIKANVESGIYCDGKRIGVTDLLLLLPVGNEFEIEIVYTDAQNERRFQKELISTKDGKDGRRKFEFSNRIKVLTGDLPFAVRIGENKLDKAPYIYDNLSTGTYKVQFILEDLEWKREWVIYNKVVTLNIAETAVIDKSDFVYKRYWGLCFIPSASQFYNFEKVKGSVILGLSIISLIESAIMGYLAYQHYYNEFLPVKNNNEDNINNADVAAIIDKQNYLRATALGGIVLFSVIYLYSCIDGFITMNHIYDIIYP